MNPVIKPAFGSRIDQGHPLAPRWVCLFNENFGDSPYLMNSNWQIKGVNSGTTATWVTNLYGPALNMAGTNTSFAFYTATLTPFYPTGPCTCLVIRKKVDTTARNSACFGSQSGSGTQRFAAFMPFGDGNVYWDYGGSAAPNRVTWTGYTETTNIEFWAFTAGPLGSAIYLDGLVVASQSTGITRTLGGSPFQIGSAAGVGGDLMHMILFAMDDRQWTSDMVWRWRAEPFCFIKKPERHAFSKIVTAATPSAGSFYRRRIS